MPSLETEVVQTQIEVAFAITEQKEKSFLEQMKDKNSWLEMLTPASFSDIDLRESLAIESSSKENRNRKILNAFIPESLVK